MRPLYGWTQLNYSFWPADRNAAHMRAKLIVTIGALRRVMRSLAGRCSRARTIRDLLPFDEHRGNEAPIEALVGQRSSQPHKSF